MNSTRRSFSITLPNKDGVYTFFLRFNLLFMPWFLLGLLASVLVESYFDDHSIYLTPQMLVIAAYCLGCFMVWTLAKRVLLMANDKLLFASMLAVFHGISIKLFSIVFAN